jgi:hypothetical protein
VDADPLLAADLTLPAGSPAIDKGTASYAWNGEQEQVLSIPAFAYSGTAPDLGFREYTGGPPLNQAPVVNAGPDRTVTLPAAANLNGTVTDDGLPSASVTTAWTQVSGPGTTAFGNPRRSTPPPPSALRVPTSSSSAAPTASSRRATPSR